MQTTRTPGPDSTILLEIELPADRLSRSIDDAVRRLSRRTKIPGFRPGKAPRPVLERHLGPTVILDEAVDHLVSDAYREALIKEEILPLTNPDVELVQAEDGKPLVFKATVQVRPEVELGDYKGFDFSPEIDTIDDERIDQVLEGLRDQNATLAAVEGRGAQDGDYAVVAFVGTRDGEPFDGGSTERMPLILGQERLIPGFETHLLGLAVGGTTEFDITFPEDYQESSLAGQETHFSVELKELREKVKPDLDDDFVGTLGEFADVQGLRVDIKARLERNALDRARHGFADSIIHYAVENATVELPAVLIDQEVEVMHDEFRGTLARQGMTEEAYLKAIDKTEADMHAEFRPGAEKRVKTLLVLSSIADAEAVTVPEEAIEAEIAKGRERYTEDPKLQAYVESERGRSYIRNTLRRTRVIEGIVDDWLAAHPDHVPLPHLEDTPGSHDHDHEPNTDAAINATEQGSITEDVPASAG